MAETYTSVGKLGKPHGIRGAFRFLLHRELKNKKKFPAHFMIQQKGNFLPWFVKEVEWLGFSEGFILFEEIATPEKAKQFSGSDLFFTEKEISKYFKEDANDYAFCIGYKAIADGAGEIGTIKEIIENPGQVLVVIKTNTGEVMIPLVEEFILKTDNRKKEIVFNLPEGLLEL